MQDKERLISPEMTLTFLMTDICNAVREKDGTTEPISAIDIPDRIRFLPNDNSGWMPNENWFDIESILENDTEDCAGMTISLIYDFNDTTRIFRNGASCYKIKLSDGGEIIPTKAIHDYTWNTDYDKDSGNGYSTRYIINYYNTRECALPQSQLFVHDGTLAMIWKELDISCNTGARFVGEATQWIRFDNCTWVSTNRSLNFKGDSLYKLEFLNNSSLWKGDNMTDLFRCSRLEDVDGLLKFIDLSGFADGTSYGTSLFMGSQIKCIESLNLSTNTNNSNIFNNCASLEYIGNLNLGENSSSNSNIFAYCYSLKHIGSIDTIYKDIEFNYIQFLPRRTALTILNALADYSTDSSGTVHKVRFNGQVIDRLTEEEKAIATTKGWVLSS